MSLVKDGFRSPQLFLSANCKREARHIGMGPGLIKLLSSRVVDEGKSQPDSSL